MKWLEGVDPQDKLDCLTMAWHVFVRPDVSLELGDLARARALKTAEVAEKSAQRARSHSPLFHGRLKRELKALSDTLDRLDEKIAMMTEILDAWPPLSEIRQRKLRRMYGLTPSLPPLPDLPPVPEPSPRWPKPDPLAPLDRTIEALREELKNKTVPPNPKPPRARHFVKMLGPECGVAYAQLYEDTLHHPVGRDYAKRLLEWLKTVDQSDRSQALAISELCRELDKLRIAEAATRKRIEGLDEHRRLAEGKPDLQEHLASEIAFAEGHLTIFLEPIPDIEAAITKLGYILERYGNPPEYDPRRPAGDDSDKL
ncbi:MAG TPA: hypothetical protein VHE55_10540 [Fimbriimonadaceae bacterium]|nr:hypothetical protein [Fimbriimonadaceae bacterium]